MPDDFEQLQREVGDWSESQFGESQPDLYPLLGVSEEYGELVHSVLKRKQGIRLEDDDVGEIAEIDAVGDMIVYLADFCERRGLDLSTCVDVAWGEVSARNWNSDVAYITEADDAARGRGNENGVENGGDADADACSFDPTGSESDGDDDDFEGFYVVSPAENAARAGPFKSKDAARMERDTLDDAVNGLDFVVVPGDEIAES